ncbi:putative lysyl-tRNA synthetase [Halobacteriovorax marinus SJ]|uniref:Lysyl-tRNA synthetase n=1 Tax=Halobacteriovorax marinus (strain ATCC BAA-682 / DSM 15412 / SJ) TaxID=862908 RepID=E1X014_HALMS|nr:amino acid--tRNA ligase-related protein [Halobacteriovorax marinus]CBW27950.1 putative lysyl-tRNA synthetase [Halobacteriovorax marinus SJ]
MKEKSERLKKLQKLFKLQQFIRDFFLEREFIDVLTPPMVQNPGMETHIHPFQVRSPHNKENLELYLHTSPEFHMKELLSLGFSKIYNISYCFRDEPNSTHHRPQFLMLEWYRTQEFYTTIMKDTEDLFKYCCEKMLASGEEIKSELKNFSPMKKTVQEIFLEVLKIDILEYLEKDKLLALIRERFPQVPLPPEKDDHLLSWDDGYFLLFLNEVEPKLKEYPFIILYNFPHHLSALSTINKDDSRVCDRFEVYSFGIELCNSFNELTELDLLRERFNEQGRLKENLYQYKLPEPSEFYKTMKSLPTSSGIALGVERLLMSICDIENPFYY